MPPEELRRWDLRPLPKRTQVLVIGTGAGGAATAASLSERGFEVVALEEGPDIDSAGLATHSPEAIARLYRHGGITPILGRQSIAFVEGRCLGGSTEVNSAFWHRLPIDCYERWQEVAGLREFSSALMEPYFTRLERDLSVSRLETDPLPRSSSLFRQGIEKVGWDYAEVPRCQREPAANPFQPGGKQSMQRTFLPQAIASGARLVADCKVVRLLHTNGQVTGVTVERSTRAGVSRATLAAEFVFVCGGAIQTAALLRRSGITRNVGDNLCLHPMIKAAAIFPEEVRADREVLPVYQVKEFRPEISIGGSVFTPGFLAMLLADNWGANGGAMHDWQRAALYYAATRGHGRGTIRTLPGLGDGVLVRYQLTPTDQRRLSEGLWRLCECLFAAGATAVYPSVRGLGPLRDIDEARRLLAEPIPIGSMSLSTVHAFSSCPMGENPETSAVDSFGKVHGFVNLYLNDASLLPDSPGVNPQGTIMALALRNADHFDPAKGLMKKPEAPFDGLKANGIHTSKSRQPVSPLGFSGRVLITGGSGFLGCVLRDRLHAAGLPVRILDRIDAADRPADVEFIEGDIRDPAAVRSAVTDCEVVFHAVAQVPLAKDSQAFWSVNEGGTATLLEALRSSQVRKLVHLSSSAVFGIPSKNPVDDTVAPRPLEEYGRAKLAAEHLIEKAVGAGDLDATIIRPRTILGHGRLGIFQILFDWVEEGRRIPVLGAGDNIYQFVHADDLVEACVRAAGRPGCAVYNIGADRFGSMRQTLEALCRHADTGSTVRSVPMGMAIAGMNLTSSLGLSPLAPYHSLMYGRSLYFDLERAKRELAWQPLWSNEEMICQSYDWYRANKSLVWAQDGKSAHRSRTKQGILELLKWLS